MSSLATGCFTLAIAILVFMPWRERTPVVLALVAFSFVLIAISVALTVAGNLP